MENLILFSTNVRSINTTDKGVDSKKPTKIYTKNTISFNRYFNKPRMYLYHVLQYIYIYEFMFLNKRYGHKYEALRGLSPSL